MKKSGFFTHGGIMNSKTVCYVLFVYFCIFESKSKKNVSILTF